MTLTTPTALRLCASICFALVAATPAQAQSVYRCGNAYTQQPCPNGTAIEASDPRSAEQKAQADKATRTDARLARELQTDRERAEREEYQARKAMKPTVTPVAQAPGGKQGKAKKKATETDRYLATSPKPVRKPAKTASKSTESS